jgi:hypothetical protein
MSVYIPEQDYEKKQEEKRFRLDAIEKQKKIEQNGKFVKINKKTSKFIKNS